MQKLPLLFSKLGHKVILIDVAWADQGYVCKSLVEDPDGFGDFWPFRSGSVFFTGSVFNLIIMTY